MGRTAGVPHQFSPGPGMYRELKLRHLLYHSEFKNEREMQHYAFPLLARMLGEENLTNAGIEVAIPPSKDNRWSRGGRVDLYAVGESNTHYLIECKDSRNIRGLLTGLAQLDFYSYLYKRCTGVKAQKVLLVTNLTEFFTEYLIERHKDVRLIVLGKQYHAEMEHPNG